MDFNLTLGQIKPFVYADEYQYVLDKHGLKDRSQQKITMFQIMGQLSSWCIGRLLIRNGYPMSGIRVINQFTAISKIGDDYSICEIGCGFDCYLPYNERRDYLIKQMLKEEDSAREEVSLENALYIEKLVLETLSG